MHAAPSQEQKEQRRHGEHLFPLKKYTTVLSDLYPHVTAHWHDEAELTLITEGTCTYQIQLETFHAAAGDILFVPPAALHSISVATGQEMRSETYVFHMNFLGISSADICTVKYLTPLINQDLILPPLIQTGHEAYPELLQLFHFMDQTYTDTRPGYELTMKSCLLRAVAILLPYSHEESSRPQIQTEHTLKLKQVLEYIGEHYTEDLTISRLAGLCYFSEYHFMRFFKKYVGMSCLEYIKNLRLEKAAELLSRGEVSVLEASLSAGFSNLSYFYREFKKKYGVTPKSFASEGTSSLCTNRDC
ncbi:MAG TPA: AraC family transcriptional regulator [Candidatus Mediterraneibacter stercoripullorum]|nr:AraC family transcriptional regulator [Candidatus Mediterraneibacter stercoripullorum]